jgi:hypothetical protein
MAILNAANAAQLQAALAKAVGGDKIILAAGDYGSVSITGRNYASNVTIQSGNWKNFAHFDGLQVTGSSNIMFNGLDMGRGREARDAEFTQINNVSRSTNIRFNGVNFHGDGKGDPTTDLVGLGIYDSRNVSVTNSDFDDLGRGIYVLRSNDTAVTGSNFHDIRLDGINVAATTGTSIHNNVFKDFHPVDGDHADAIQFWNTGQTQGQSNISIKNNVIWMPENYAPELDGVQGIWISDPGVYGYRNVAIENNIVYSNDRWNGISVFSGTNVQLLNNTVLSSSEEGKVLWIRVEDSRSVVMRGNVTEDMILRNNTITQSNNIDLSEAPGLRSLFADLRAPDSIFDLITPGVGYQAPSKPPAGTPVGNLPRALVAHDVTMVDVAPEAYAPIAYAPDVYEAGPIRHAFMIDSFTALP